MAALLCSGMARRASSAERIDESVDEVSGSSDERVGRSSVVVKFVLDVEVSVGEEEDDDEEEDESLGKGRNPFARSAAHRLIVERGKKFMISSCGKSRGSRSRPRIQSWRQDDRTSKRCKGKGTACLSKQPKRTSPANSTTPSRETV